MSVRGLGWIVVVCSVLMISGYASAAQQNTSYFRLSGGYSMVQDADTDDYLLGLDLEFEFENGYGGAVALGWDFGNFRVEWELVHTVNDFKQVNLLGISGDVDGDGKITSLLLNGYFDFPVKSKLTPFVGGGIGYSKIDVSDLKVRSIGYVRKGDDANTLTWHADAGISIDVSDKFAIDLRYRYLGMEDPKFETMKAEVAAHQGWIDFRFVF